MAAAGESVVDVPSKLSARVRVLSSGNARKNDELDAPLATALAAWRNERLAAVDPEAASEVLRLLSERREDLVAERTRALNRLHGLLRDFIPGGVPGTLSTHRAVRVLRGIRPQGSSASVRRRLASEIMGDSRLDGTRKGSVLQFLYESGLISTSRPVIYFHGADLSKTDLRSAPLLSVKLHGASLSRADLSEAYLAGADL